MVMVILSIAGIAVWKISFVTPPTAPPNLTQRWHEQTYGLEEDEVLRFVPPPFSPRRLQLVPGRFLSSSNSPGQVFYRSDRGPDNWTDIDATGSVYSAALSTLGLTPLDLDVPPGLRSIKADGDWFIRIPSPLERRAQALQSILSAVTGRDLVIEYRQVTRDAVVASGTFQFRALPGYEGAADLPPILLQLYVDEQDIQQERVSWGEGRWPKFFADLQSMTYTPFIDEVEGPRQTFMVWKKWAAPRPITAAPASDRFLSNLEKQTSLRFTREKRQVWTWVMRQRVVATQPGAPR
jgi:hypothetical protein